MIFLYVIAVAFILFGGIAWLALKSITGQEWAIGATVALLSAGFFHGLAYLGRTHDIEMWRGQVTRVVFYPEWVEEYEEMHTREYPCGTDSKGNTEYCTEIYYTTEYRTHHERWEAETNIKMTRSIREPDYVAMGQVLGGREITERVYKSGFHRGDHNIYYYNNESGTIIPVNDIKSWSNKLKAAPSIYDFPQVSEEQAKSLFSWPENKGWRNSGTLLGETGGLTIEEWDKVAAKLGPVKQANIIFIGFPASASQTTAVWQQAYWSGGKKNDVVICAGLNGSRAEWVYSFGWSNDAAVWAYLNDLFLHNEVNNSILPEMYKIILTHYDRKEWADFKHISINPPQWSYIVFPLILILTQGGLYVFFHLNEFTKDKKKRYEYGWTFQRK